MLVDDTLVILYRNLETFLGCVLCIQTLQQQPYWVAACKVCGDYHAEQLLTHLCVHTGRVAAAAQCRERNRVHSK